MRKKKRLNFIFPSENKQMKHSGSASVNVQKSLDLGGSIFILPVEECNVLHTELNQVNNNQLSWADSSHSIVDVLCVQEHCTSPAVSSLLLSDQKVNDTKQPTWRTSQTFFYYFFKTIHLFHSNQCWWGHSWVLYPVVHPQGQETRTRTGKSPSQGHQGEQGLGAPLLSGEA